MTQPNDDDDSKPEATFTRAQMAKMVNAQVKEKLAASLAEYGDLDELRAQAAAAKASESKMDQLLAKMSAAEERANAAEATNLRRLVADELGLTPAQAKRLAGKTRDELLADGEEMIQDMGIKPGKKTAPATKDPEGEELPDDVEDDAPAEQEVTPPTRQRSTRPTETLRPGAARTQAKPEETDPMKLAALIPRR